MGAWSLNAASDYDLYAVVVTGVESEFYTFKAGGTSKKVGRYGIDFGILIPLA